MYDVLLISYGANGCLSTLFSYFIYFFQDQMCVSVRVYMCVRGHERAYLFCIWGVMAYIGECGRCIFRVHIVLTSSLQKCTIYILFFYMFFSIQKELKVTAPRKVFLRW